MTRDGDAIVGIQTVRNAIMAVTFLVTAVGFLLPTFIDMLSQKSVRDDLAELAASDPLVGTGSSSGGGGGVSVVVKMGLVISLFLATIIILSQSARLYSHASFYCKSIPHHAKHGGWPGLGIEAGNWNAILSRAQVRF